MEEFVATELAPVDLIRRRVNDSEIYLGNLGMRYGFVEPGTGLSMTELEYRQAVASKKTICMFVMDQNAPITAGMVEDDPARLTKLKDFKSRVTTDHVCVFFTDPTNLAQKAGTTLKEYRRA
jgi:hypothetical protein